jgi:hypothetical protein
MYASSVLGCSAESAVHFERAPGAQGFPEFGGLMVMVMVMVMVVMFHGGDFSASYA